MTVENMKKIIIINFFKKKKSHFQIIGKGMHFKKKHNFEG